MLYAEASHCAICKNDGEEAWDLEEHGEVYNTPCCLSNVHLYCIQRSAESQDGRIDCPEGCTVHLPLYTYSDQQSDKLQAIMAVQNAKADICERQRFQTESAEHLIDRRNWQLAGGAGQVSGGMESVADVFVINKNGATMFTKEERARIESAVAVRDASRGEGV